MFVDCDFTSLEVVVLTELSRDDVLWSVFGPGARPNDIYLATGARMGGALGNRIRSTGYNPESPTLETVALAKKECKTERGVAKTMYLSCIAEGTPIRVRGQGFKSIEDVAEGDEVWDGTSWVTTSGSIFKGLKKCSHLADINMTEDHRVLDTEGNWHEQRKYTIQKGTSAPQPYRPRKPSASWADVWALVCSLFGRKKARGLPLRTS